MPGRKETEQDPVKPVVTPVKASPPPVYLPIAPISAPARPKERNQGGPALGPVYGPPTPPGYTYPTTPATPTYTTPAPTGVPGVPITESAPAPSPQPSGGGGDSGGPSVPPLPPQPPPTFYVADTKSPYFSIPREFLGYMTDAQRAQFADTLKQMGYAPQGQVGQYGEQLYEKGGGRFGNPFLQLDPALRDWLNFFLGNNGYGISYQVPDTWTGTVGGGVLPPAPPQVTTPQPIRGTPITMY